MHKPLVLLCLLNLAAPPEAAAQAVGAPGNDADTAPPRIRIGPVGLTPSIVISDVGVDTNVFSTADNPQRDYTARVSPGLLSGIRMGRARLATRTSLGFSYFREARQARTADIQQEGRLSFLFNRFTPRVSGQYGRLRQRPNLEIDTRVLQFTRRVGLGTDLRISPRLELTLDAAKLRRDYDDEFGGVNLGTALRQRTDQGIMSIRMALTPLTTFVIIGDVMRDRFAFAPIRNTNSIGVTPGFEMKPFALISGTAFFGFRQIHALDATVPDYHGLTGNVAVNYTLMGRVRLTLTGHRGVDYSFESLTPYYVWSGAGLAASQALGRGWDVRGAYGGDALAYRQLLTAPAGLAHTDRIIVYGFGVGRRVSANARAGVDVNHAVRYSPIRARRYEGWRAGGTFTYGS